MTGAEYMGRVAALPCAICRRLGHIAHPVEVHHQRAGTGAGRRASDFATMPLCFEHHRGRAGIHTIGTKLFARTHEVTEHEIVNETREALGVSAEQAEVWEQALRDRKRKVPQPARSKKASDAAAARPRWPSRRLASRGSFRPGTRVQAAGSEEGDA